MTNGNEAWRAGHVLGEIQACVDGELPAATAERVRAHAAACPACARALAQAEATWSALAVYRVPEGARPAWPRLRARLRSPRRSPLSFATGAAAAAVAGLLLGLVVGRALPTGATGADPAETLSSWAQDGSLLAAGGAATLDSLFLAAGEASAGEEKEVRP